MRIWTKDDGRKMAEIVNNVWETTGRVPKALQKEIKLNMEHGYGEMIKEFIERVNREALKTIYR